MPVEKKVTSKKTTVTLSETKGIIKKKLYSSPSTSAQDQNDKKVSPLASRKSGILSIPVYSLSGRAVGTMSLPKEIFGQKVNKSLLAQALRVYMTNQKSHPGSTKTRGEVRGSTAKVWRQKGTGRARHGAKTAPIFVGGGITFGPKPRKTHLELPKKMRKAALVSALSDKAGDKGILGVSGLEKATGKTKEMAGLVRKIREIREIKGSTLIITGEKQENVVRGVRNIPGIDALPANQLNAYEVLRYRMLLVTKEAVNVILGGAKRPIESEKKDSGPFDETQGKQARMTRRITK